MCCVLCAYLHTDGGTRVVNVMGFFFFSIFVYTNPGDEIFELKGIAAL